MIFQAFHGRSSRMEALNRDVADFIRATEAKGFRVADKTVHVEGAGSSAFSEPHIIVTVWMEKPISLS